MTKKLFDEFEKNESSLEHAEVSAIEMRIVILEGVFEII